MKFLITTPVFNGSAYIDETIASVVTQAGPFELRYHVQDGGSTDDTINKLQAWKLRIENGFPKLSDRLEFSYSSEPDAGLYHAISKGFHACGDGDVMTWINADDRLELGSLASVIQLLADQSISWVCGRGALVDETGAIYKIRPIVPYAQDAIRAGLFDGRVQESFIMQEGSFWRKELWDKTGGLNTDYRLAGDFDLWRRFAAHSDLVIADAIFGYFRVREGQLSANLQAYHGEIDQRMSDLERRLRTHANHRYRTGLVHHRTATRECKQDWEVNNITLVRLLGRRLYKIKHSNGIVQSSPFNACG